jgi:poly(3-hydroxybutyrate) depolymerase
MTCASPETTLHPTPAIARRLLESTLASCRTTIDATLDYWQGALRRSATPLDVALDASLWWREMTSRRPPTWASPHRVVLESPIARVRDFTIGADPVVPTVVLPPQAGHDSCIVDYSPEQSQINTIQAAGLTRLHSLDWLGATQQTKDASIEDYLDFTARAITYIGPPVNLIGDCQGGWLATIYASLHPEQVNTLTLAGAPIDFHAGEPVIHDYLRFLDDEDLSFYREMVRLGGGVMKGELMLGGFIAIKPENEFAKRLQLLVNVREERHVARYRAFGDWFEHTQDIPGALYLWIVEHLFRDNALVSGALEIGGERVDLRRIVSPLNLLAGAMDHITPPDQVFATERAVSSPPAEVVKRVTPGGHLGLFMGHEALREHWPPILAGVHERSRLS